MINYLKNDSTIQDDVFIKDRTAVKNESRSDEQPIRGREPRFSECRTRYSFHAEFDGCLTVQKGQILFLQRHNNDGWSLGIMDFTIFRISLFITAVITVVKLLSKF